jgi:hypothetical protein
MNFSMVYRLGIHKMFNHKKKQLLTLSSINCHAIKSVDNSPTRTEP